jgi:hypothetical protein
MSLAQGSAANQKAALTAAHVSGERNGMSKLTVLGRAGDHQDRRLQGRCRLSDRQRESTGRPLWHHTRCGPRNSSRHPLEGGAATAIGSRPSSLGDTNRLILSRNRPACVMIVFQRLFIAIIAACCAGSVATASAADITVASPDANGRIFVDVAGEIALGDAKTFDEKSANLEGEHVYVSLKSNGGNALAGGSIGDTIRVRGMSTYIPPNASCVSVCSVIWLAGREKFADNSAHVGFHGVYDPNTLQPSNTLNIMFAVYLSQLGYGYDDVLWMLLSPPGNFHWLTTETAREHHIHWAELNPLREQTPPAPRPVAQYTAADHVVHPHQSTQIAG